MGLWGKRRTKEYAELGAPAAGKVVPLVRVSDPAFSGEMLGRGVAILPASERIVSPCDGKIDVMFETGHAVTLKADSGAEVLIHIGIDTVKLQGRHFHVHCRAGDRVKKGQLLIGFDREAIVREGYDPVTPVLVCNSDAFSLFEIVTDKVVIEGETVIRLAGLSCHSGGSDS